MSSLRKLVEGSVSGLYEYDFLVGKLLEYETDPEISKEIKSHCSRCGNVSIYDKDFLGMVHFEIVDLQRMIEIFPSSGEDLLLKLCKERLSKYFPGP
jgi:hypothetical protein